MSGYPHLFGLYAAIRVIHLTAWQQVVTVIAVQDDESAR